jgi:integrase
VHLGDKTATSPRGIGRRASARLHDLRHLHATTLLLAGVPVHVVAARLGHADPAVTLRVYSHVLREHAAGVGDIFA